MSMDSLVKKLLSDVEKLQEAEGGSPDILDEIHAFDVTQAITASAIVKAVNEFAVSQSALPGMSVAGQAKGTFKVNASDSVAVDLSGSGNHGTVTGAQRVGGMIGDGLLFDGVNDYVNCGNGASLNVAGIFTLSAWFYGNDDGYIIAKRDGTNQGYNMFISAGWLRIVDGSGATVNLGVAVNADAWNYGVIVVNGTTATGYINNVSGGDKTIVAFSDNTVNLYFGNRVGGTATTTRFAGKIDEVMIYNRALTPTEISNRYNSGNGVILDPAGETGLVGYWRFDPVRVGFADAG